MCAQDQDTVEKRTTLNSDTCLSLTRNVTPSHRNLHALIGQPVLCRHVSCVTRDKDFRRTRKLDARFSPTQTGARKHRALSSHFVPSSHSLLLLTPSSPSFPFLFFPDPLQPRPCRARCPLRSWHQSNPVPNTSTSSLQRVQKSFPCLTPSQRTKNLLQITTRVVISRSK